MSNRRIEMHEYRQVIYRLKAGQSARCVSRETRFGREKVREIQKKAQELGWLEAQTALPKEEVLREMFVSVPPSDSA